MKIKKPRNYGKNLGKYLHPAKLPSGAKIGKGSKFGKPTVAKPSRRRIKRMETPKGI